MERTYCILRCGADEHDRGGGAGTRAREAGGPTVPPRMDITAMSVAEARAVATDPDVRALAPAMPTKLIRPVSGPVEVVAEPGPTWGITAVGADTSPRSGAGVTVAVLDTGIDATHPAFTGADIVQADFSGSGDGDRAGHGTHCAGTIFGRDVDGTRIGVAPGVTRALVGKVLDDEGGGDSTMLFAGVQWAVREGAHVLSMSLGFDFPGLVAQLVRQGFPPDLATSSALEGYRANLRMLDALMDVVTSQEPFGPAPVVVAAAGNESRRDVNPEHEIGASLPAAAEGVLSVGALARSDAGLTVAPFSNTFPRVVAPGVDITSARAGGGLATMSGTSMATPHAAGVAALWWEDVLASDIPHIRSAVTSHLLSACETAPLAPGLDVADRGVGLVRAPQPRAVAPAD